MTRTLTFSRRTLMLCLGFGVALTSSTARSFAQSDAGGFSSQVNELIRDLQPHEKYADEKYADDKLPRGGRNTRKVIVKDRYGSGTRVYYVDYDSSASLSVEFQKGSNRLSAKSRQLLKLLATALSSRNLSHFTYMIAGHTDSSGSRAYNQALSERRALSVADHLTDRFDISGKRLVPVGFGEDQLRDKYSPHSRVNRRVEVGLIVEGPYGYDNSSDDGYSSQTDKTSKAGEENKPKTDEPSQTGGNGDTNTLITD